MDGDEHYSPAAPASVSAASLPSVQLPEHFLQLLDFELGVDEANAPTLRIELADQRCDLGLAATLIDVLGGHVAMSARYPCLIATTHIEAHGVASLHGPGPLILTARVVGASKSRMIVEIAMRTSSTTAISHAGFAIRSQEDMPPLAARVAKTGQRRIITGPLWSLIGSSRSEGGAFIHLRPEIENHVGALQGGASVGLMEAAALTAVGADELIDDLTVNYLQQARAELITARVARRDGQHISVDLESAGTLSATAVFRTRLVGQER